MSKEGLILGGDFPPSELTNAIREAEMHGLELEELDTLLAGGIESVNEVAANDWQQTFGSNSPADTGIIPKLTSYF